MTEIESTGMQVHAKLAEELRKERQEKTVLLKQFRDAGQKSRKVCRGKNLDAMAVFAPSLCAFA